MWKKYKCNWCGVEFERYVEYWKGNTPYGIKQAKHKGCGSSIVKCPKCLNNIPTWKREETGNIIGKKHIHIRR